MTAIHPADATERSLILKRVSPDFVEAVRQHRIDRKDQVQAQEFREHFRQRRSSPHYLKEDDEDFE